MKGKRLVASMLALLLVVSLLPMAAMAESNTNERIEKEVTYDYNEATNVTNYGTVTNNYADPLTSPAPSITPSIKDNNGTVVNNGGSSDSEKGIVVNNKSDGTVEHNNPKGTVENNYGLVGKVVDGKLDTTGNYGNSGKVENNQTGGVVVNNKDGKVENNQQGGVVVNNSGTVNNDEDRGIVSFNYSSGDGTNPGVINNGGFVGTNCNGGTVVNNEGGTVHYNTSSGNGTNPGVINNGGTVDANNGTVDNFAGQVYSNNTGGTILNNYGTVGLLPDGETGTPQHYNRGTVETNHMSGWVTNHTYYGGVVEKNYGTVYEIQSEIKGTYYGLHGEDENKETDTKYTEEGYSLGHTAGAEVNLDDTAASYQREGYKLSSYTVWTYNKNSNATDKLEKQDVADRTKYTINAPTLLKLVWEKIVTAVAPAASNEPEAKPVKAAALPSTVAAEDVKVGTVVRVKGQLFRVIEMDDGSMTVVTMGKLSKKDMEDLMAFLAKYFTPEQIELLLGDPELISGALAEELFGGNTGHIVFKAARNLFA